MEYNLNKAAGFKGFDYFYDGDKPQYTRMVHINWMGNPSNPADYIAVEPIATITAKGMVPLIKQLKEAGIKINVIAHSAGNIVLVQLMNELGKLSNEPYFDNVFLWEAAIPDTALSPDADKLDKSLSQRWHTQHAYQAAKHIHVLYSHHDSVLGPVPVTVYGACIKQILNKN
jgi:hypothetical protein